MEYASGNCFSKAIKMLVPKYPPSPWYTVCNSNNLPTRVITFAYVLGIVNQWRVVWIWMGRQGNFHSNTFIIGNRRLLTKWFTWWSSLVEPCGDAHATKSEKFTKIRQSDHHSTPYYRSVILGKFMLALSYRFISHYESWVTQSAY